MGHWVRVYDFGSVSGKSSEVRVVPHPGGWAVKLVGGIGNKPGTVNAKKQLVMAEARGVARKYQVSLAEYDKDMNLVKRTPWKSL